MKNLFFWGMALAAVSMLVFAPSAEADIYVGKASYYKTGRITANGEAFKPLGLTAAHRTLPFGTRVRVTHLGSGRNVIVRINDRGPFIRNRIIDLSLGAAQKIGMTKSGIVRVKMEVLDP